MSFSCMLAEIDGKLEFVDVQYRGGEIVKILDQKTLPASWQEMRERLLKEGYDRSLFKLHRFAGIRTEKVS